MNNNQLQDWITDLNKTFGTKVKTEKRLPDERATQYRRLLDDIADNTNYLNDYLICNFEDTRLSQPLISQLLSLYYRGGIARCFVLQIVPSITSMYLTGITKRQKQCTSMFETFLLAIYNEEILAGGPGSPVMNKKSEEIRIPSVGYPSIYHDPSKIQPYPEVTQLKYGGSPSVQKTIRIGPYPPMDRIIAENRFTLLTKLLKSINGNISHMSAHVICRSYCRSLITICKSGFSFPESEFRHRILKDEASSEILGDHSKKPRIPVSPYFLIESLNGLHFALFNGHADLSLRALDAIHQRAQYEMLADVLLATNAIKNSLQETHNIKSMLELEVNGAS
uniref:Uncharacterized protein n=1 Tax=Acrobeloides nanus TaxID=290746 RepID=A0A914C6P1_9BILA